MHDRYTPHPTAARMLARSHSRRPRGCGRRLLLAVLLSLGVAASASQSAARLVEAEPVAERELTGAEAATVVNNNAAAVVLGAGDGGPKILASRLKTYAEGAALCEIPAGGSRFHPRRINVPFEPLTSFSMQGKGVFRLAAKHLPALMDDLLQQAGLQLDQIDWVIPHQASQQAMQHAARRLCVSPQKLIDIFARHGNQVAASLPTALDIAVRDGRIQRGHTLMLIGTGAGLSLGGMILEY